MARGLFGLKGANSVNPNYRMMNYRGKMRGMALDTVSTERRKNLRKRPPRLIYVELSAGNGGMVRDISEDGFALRAMMPMTAGERTPFSFLLGETTRIEGEGEIVWVEEKGKVAGIRFTQMSAQTRKLMQNWLNDISEVPENKEEDQNANAQNFDQLREELHNAPPRESSPKPNRSRWPVEPRESEPAGGFEEAPEESPDETRRDREWRSNPDPIPFPGAAAHDAHRSEPAPRRAAAGNAAAHVPPLPDISKILMQPPKKGSSYGHQSPVFEPLDSWHHGGEMYEPRRSGWFTPSRAIMIMIAIAATVAIYAYHEMVGETLVWMGQQISGSAPTQTQTPPPSNEASSSPAVTPPPTNASGSEAPTSTKNEAAPEPKQENSGNTNHPESSAPSRPAPATNAPSAPPTADVSPESGSMEYSKAQQLLHGPGADSSEAVRLLWISVEKGNPSAELTLAELYWHGRGVARNCDQTRILLSAAARKGNADAQRLLHLFQREGCE